MSNADKTELDWKRCENLREEGNRNVVFGLGAGAFGAGSLALIGATCPLCFFVAPALVGVGIWKRQKASRLAEETWRAHQAARRAADSAFGGTDGTLPSRKRPRG